MTKTNETTKAIIKYLNYAGHCAFRNNTQGTYDPTRKVRRRLPSWHGARGSGDVICCLRGGGYMEVEVKTGGDALSPEQIDRHDKIRDLGGIVLVVKDLDDFMEQFGKAAPQAWAVCLRRADRKPRQKKPPV